MDSRDENPGTVNTGEWIGSSLDAVYFQMNIVDMRMVSGDK
jgi:hypothetical protein